MKISNLLQLPFSNVFLFSLFWALQIFVSKLAFKAGAHPVTFLLQSTLVNWLTLSIIVLPKKWKELKNIKKDVLKGIILANAIHFGFGAFFSNSGVALTTAINAGFLMKFAMVTTLLMAWIFLKEKLTLSKSIAALVMFFGVFLLSTQGRLIVPQVGDLLIILACLSWSTGNVILRKILRENSVSGETVSFLRPISGFPLILLFIIFAPIYPIELREVFQVNFFDFGYTGYVVVAGMFVALLTLFLNRTLKVASASYMTMMSMMTPVFVAILALSFLGERMVSIQILGATLIILSGAVTHCTKVAKQ